MAFSLTYLNIDFYPMVIASVVFLKRHDAYDSFEAKPYSAQHEQLSMHLWNESKNNKLSLTVENIIFDLVVETRKFETLKKWKEHVGVRDYRSESGSISRFFVCALAKERWYGNIDTFVTNIPNHMSRKEILDFLLRRPSERLTMYAIARLLIWKRRFLDRHYMPTGRGFLSAKSDFNQKRIDC